MRFVRGVKRKLQKDIFVAAAILIGIVAILVAIGLLA